jgi:hypothetical protein
MIHIVTESVNCYKLEVKVIDVKLSTCVVMKLKLSLGDVVLQRNKCRINSTISNRLAYSCLRLVLSSGPRLLKKIAFVGCMCMSI